MASGFAWTIPGGLNKAFYTRFRELRKKYDLKDRDMVECLIHLALVVHHFPKALEAWETIIEQYRATAPEDMKELPAVR